VKVKPAVRFDEAAAEALRGATVEAGRRRGRILAVSAARTGAC